MFAVAGAFFGLIVGWVIGSQQAGRAPLRAAARRRSQAAPAPAAQAADAASRRRRARSTRRRRRRLQAVAEKNPADAKARVQLGNLYFDAERYPDAIAVVRGGAEDRTRTTSNVSTDLGVCYYYTNQPDRALQQFEESLKIDPKHAKTLLNQGIVRAFGKQDLDGRRGRVGEADSDGARRRQKRRPPGGAAGAEVRPPGSWPVK